MCRTDDFDIVKSVCRPVPVPLPLFSTDLAHQVSTQLARLHASKISRRWNLWVPTVKPRPGGVRPLGWIVKTSPFLLVRAEFAGDLRSSALACLQPSGVSEAELAQLCGTTLDAMHRALDGLEQCDMIRRSRAGRNCRVSLKQQVPRLAVRA
jgi:hypothetical protein